MIIHKLKKKKGKKKSMPNNNFFLSYQPLLQLYESRPGVVYIHSFLLI